MDIGFFVCGDELFEDTYKTLSRIFALLQSDDDWLSVLDIMQQSMLYKMCLWFSLRWFVDGLIDDRVIVDEECFTNALKRKLNTDDLSAISTEQLKSSAKQVLTSLCYGVIDQYILVAPNQYDAIRDVVMDALYFRNRDARESSSFRILYEKIYQYARQYSRVLHEHKVSNGTISVGRADVTKTIEKHMQYVMVLFQLCACYG